MEKAETKTYPIDSYMRFAEFFDEAKTECVPGRETEFIIEGATITFGSDWSEELKAYGILECARTKWLMKYGKHYKVELVFEWDGYEENEYEACLVARRAFDEKKLVHRIVD